MLVYHGSNMSVEQPRILRRNRYLDFGFGFYTTTNKEQAADFSKKVVRRERSGTPIVSVYKVNESAIAHNLRFAGTVEDGGIKSMLMTIVPQLIELVEKNRSVDEQEATRIVFQSRLYDLLEDEETALWHLSPLALYDILDTELRTGRLEFPEEV